MSTFGISSARRIKALIGCSTALFLTIAAPIQVVAANVPSKAIQSAQMAAIAVSKNSATHRAMLGEGIPVNVSIPNTLPQSSGFYVTVTVNNTSTGASAKIDVTDRSHLVSPTGSWPYTVNFAPNAPTSATFWVSTVGTPSASEAGFVACQSNRDITVASNWTAATLAKWDHSMDPPKAPVSKTIN